MSGSLEEFNLNSLNGASTGHKTSWLEGSISSVQHAGGVPYPAYRREYGTQRKFPYQFALFGFQNLSFLIPGTGDLGDKDCGIIKAFIYCNGCGHHDKLTITCRGAECPVCWSKWAIEETESIIERKDAFEEAYKASKGKRLGNPKHIILSPPQGREIKTIEELKRLRGAAIRKARRIGLKGGFMIFHAHRVKEELKSELQEINKITQKGFWDLIRKDALGLGSWREYVVRGPHFHIVGYGRVPRVHQVKIGSTGRTKWVKETSSRVYKSTGWVYKLVEHKSNNTELGKLVFYLLSHCGLPQSKTNGHEDLEDTKIKAVTWFGGLSYNKLVEDRDKRVEEWQQKKCPECGEGLYIQYFEPVGWIGEDEGVPPESLVKPYIVKVVHRTFYLKGG